MRMLGGSGGLYPIDETRTITLNNFAKNQYKVRVTNSFCLIYPVLSDQHSINGLYLYDGAWAAKMGQDFRQLWKNQRPYKHGSNPCIILLRI